MKMKCYSFRNAKILIFKTLMYSLESTNLHYTEHYNVKNSYYYVFFFLPRTFQCSHIVIQGVNEMVTVGISVGLKLYFQFFQNSIVPLSIYSYVLIKYFISRIFLPVELSCE